MRDGYLGNKSLTHWYAHAPSLSQILLDHIQYIYSTPIYFNPSPSLNPDHDCDCDITLWSNTFPHRDISAYREYPETAQVRPDSLLLVATSFYGPRVLNVSFLSSEVTFWWPFVSLTPPQSVNQWWGVLIETPFTVIYVHFYVVSLLFYFYPQRFSGLGCTQSFSCLLFPIWSILSWAHLSHKSVIRQIC